MAPNVRMTVNNDFWRELKQLQPIQNYQLNIQTETEKATKTSIRIALELNIRLTKCKGVLIS
jgi:hypothetical protein